MNPEKPESAPQPVAYDAEGRPLYHHPPRVEEVEEAEIVEAAAKNSSHVTTRPESIDGHNFNPQLRSQYANEPKIVHAARSYEPTTAQVSEKLKAKHEASIERYPHLNLSEGEYVILDIKRHPIGLLMPIFAMILLLGGIFAFASFYPSIYDAAASAIMPSMTAMFGIIVLLSALVVLGGAVALWVYLQNEFFMTNESVIQEIQDSLFSRHEQTVSLGSIEDASYVQGGILQTILDYGTIRLSTEGEETTYIFRYVSRPRRQIAVLNNAIEAFKNGRPVYDD
jgi:hypothetical protein